MRHQDSTWKPNSGKPPMELVTTFHSSQVSPVRSQPYERLQNTLLGVTLLKYLNHLVRNGLVRGLKTLQSRNSTLLEDLQK